MRSTTRRAVRSLALILAILVMAATPASLAVREVRGGTAAQDYAFLYENGYAPYPRYRIVESRVRPLDGLPLRDGSRVRLEVLFRFFPVPLDVEPKIVVYPDAGDLFIPVSITNQSWRVGTDFYVRATVTYRFREAWFGGASPYVGVLVQLSYPGLTPPAFAGWGTAVKYPYEVDPTKFSLLCSGPNMYVNFETYGYLQVFNETTPWGAPMVGRPALLYQWPWLALRDIVVPRYEPDYSYYRAFSMIFVLKLLRLEKPPVRMPVELIVPREGRLALYSDVPACWPKPDPYYIVAYPLRANETLLGVVTLDPPSAVYGENVTWSLVTAKALTDYVEDPILRIYAVDLLNGTTGGTFTVRDPYSGEDITVGIPDTFPAGGIWVDEASPSIWVAKTHSGPAIYPVDLAVALVYPENASRPTFDVNGADLVASAMRTASIPMLRNETRDVSWSLDSGSFSVLEGGTLRGLLTGTFSGEVYNVSGTIILRGSFTGSFSGTFWGEMDLYLGDPYNYDVLDGKLSGSFENVSMNINVTISADALPPNTTIPNGSSVTLTFDLSTDWVEGALTGDASGDIVSANFEGTVHGPFQVPVRFVVELHLYDAPWNATRVTVTSSLWKGAKIYRFPPLEKLYPPGLRVATGLTYPARNVYWLAPNVGLFLLEDYPVARDRIDYKISSSGLDVRPLRTVYWEVANGNLSTVYLLVEQPDLDNPAPPTGRAKKFSVTVHAFGDEERAVFYAVYRNVFATPYGYQPLGPATSTALPVIAAVPHFSRNYSAMNTTVFKPPQLSTAYWPGARQGWDIALVALNNGSLFAATEDFDPKATWMYTRAYIPTMYWEFLPANLTIGYLTPGKLSWWTPRGVEAALAFPKYEYAYYTVLTSSGEVDEVPVAALMPGTLTFTVTVPPSYTAKHYPTLAYPFLNLTWYTSFGVGNHTVVLQTEEGENVIMPLYLYPLVTDSYPIVLRFYGFPNGTEITVEYVSQHGPDYEYLGQTFAKMQDALTLMILNNQSTPAFSTLMADEAAVLYSPRGNYYYVGTFILDEDQELRATRMLGDVSMIDVLERYGLDKYLDLIDYSNSLYADIAVDKLSETIATRSTVTEVYRAVCGGGYVYISSPLGTHYVALRINITFPRGPWKASFDYYLTYIEQLMEENVTVELWPGYVLEVKPSIDFNPKDLTIYISLDAEYFHGPYRDGEFTGIQLDFMGPGLMALLGVVGDYVPLNGSAAFITGMAKVMVAGAGPGRALVDMVYQPMTSPYADLSFIPLSAGNMSARVTYDWPGEAWYPKNVTVETSLLMAGTMWSGTAQVADAVKIRDFYGDEIVLGWIKRPTANATTTTTTTTATGAPPPVWSRIKPWLYLLIGLIALVLLGYVERRTRRSAPRRPQPSPPSSS